MTVLENVMIGALGQGAGLRGTQKRRPEMRFFVSD